MSNESKAPLRQRREMKPKPIYNECCTENYVPLSGKRSEKLLENTMKINGQITDETDYN